MIEMSYARRVQASAYFVSFVSFIQASCATPNAEFSSNCRLQLIGAPRVCSPGKKAWFHLTFSTEGSKVLWPGRREFSFLVNGKRMPLPRRRWGDYNYAIHQHILPGRPHRVAWRWPGREMKNRLGVGKHKIWFRFGSVRSNPLPIAIDKHGYVRIEPQSRTARTGNGNSNY